MHSAIDSGRMLRSYRTKNMPTETQSERKKRDHERVSEPRDQDESEPVLCIIVRADGIGVGRSRCWLLGSFVRSFVWCCVAGSEAILMYDRRLQARGDLGLQMNYALSQFFVLSERSHTKTVNTKPPTRDSHPFTNGNNSNDNGFPAARFLFRFGSE
jgi:hypothetical protein